MAKKQGLHFETSLPYEGAGLRFRITLDLQEDRPDDQGATVRVVAEDLQTGKRVPFNNEASPALADFMAGYPRWMVRVGVRATQGADEITGRTRPDAGVDALLGAVRQIADMIDQNSSENMGGVLVGGARTGRPWGGPVRRSTSA